MIKNYELMVIFSPKLNEDEANKMNETVLALVTDQGGEIVKTDPWGRRLLAYPINKVQEGYYFVNYLKMESTNVKNVKHQLGISEHVIRHMFIVKEN